MSHPYFIKSKTPALFDCECQDPLHDDERGSRVLNSDEPDHYWNPNRNATITRVCSVCYAVRRFKHEERMKRRRAELSAMPLKWIATTDALPEWGEMVLVYSKPLGADGKPLRYGFDQTGGHQDIASYEEIEGDGHWMGQEYAHNTKVSHWMALPSPPTEQAV